MKLGWLKNILLGFLKDELASLAEQEAAKLRHAENTSVRDLLVRRRTELSGLPPVEAINRLVDKVEKEEGKRNGYADLLWRVVAGQEQGAPVSLVDVKSSAGVIERS